MGVDDTNGTWQYTDDFGENWVDFGEVSESNAVLLTDNIETGVRFVPDPDFNGVVENGLSFRGWDKTGGNPQQIQRMKELAALLGIKNITYFLGQRPVEEMPVFMQFADILVSPRKEGKNTPLKIYSYLKSGKPIVATKILTHTQVLNDDVAMLTNNNPEAFADGTLKLIKDKKLGQQLAANALRLSEEKYSYKAYLEKTNQIY